MSDNIVTSLGSKLYIGGTGALNSENAWVEVGDIATIGEFGDSFQEVNFTPIATGFVEKYKGAMNAGNIQLGLGRAPSDAGQAAMILARNNKTKDNRYNFKIELNDDPGSASGETPTTFKFKALAMSYSTNINDVNSVVQATAQLGIITGTLTETAATT